MRAAEPAWRDHRCNGAWHRTYWIAQWPRLDVGATFFSALLLTSSAVRSVSVVFEPLDPLRARAAAEAAVTTD
jgi:hypothetical protein